MRFLRIIHPIIIPCRNLVKVTENIKEGKTELITESKRHHDSGADWAYIP